MLRKAYILMPFSDMLFTFCREFKKGRGENSNEKV
jgi:hypothetical protein